MCFPCGHDCGVWFCPPRAQHTIQGNRRPVCIRLTHWKRSQLTIQSRWMPTAGGGGNVKRRPHCPSHALAVPVFMCSCHSYLRTPALGSRFGRTGFPRKPRPGKRLLGSIYLRPQKASPCVSPTAFPTTGVCSGITRTCDRASGPAGPTQRLFLPPRSAWGSAPGSSVGGNTPRPGQGLRGRSQPPPMHHRTRWTPASLSPSLGDCRELKLTGCPLPGTSPASGALHAARGTLQDGGTAGPGSLCRCSEPRQAAPWAAPHPGRCRLGLSAPSSLSLAQPHRVL